MTEVVRTMWCTVAVVGSFGLAVAACGGSSAAVVTMVFMGESFTMSGAAVDEGVVCASGQAVEVASRGGFESDEFVTDVEVTCDDGTGTFIVRSDITVPVVESNIEGTWTIVGGGGNYTPLEGGGDLTVEIADTFIITYSGELSTG